MPITLLDPDCWYKFTGGKFKSQLSHILRDWSWNHFLQSFSPFHWFKSDRCQLLAKVCAQVVVNSLTLILLNNLISHTHFCLTANQITSYNVSIQIHKLNNKQCRSWSDGFFRSHLIWIYTVCKVRVVMNSRIRLKGLSLPRKSVCRLTYQLDILPP